MKIIILFIFLTRIIFAETYNVDLNTAIKLALENNKQHKISKLALQIAQAQYKQASSLNFPTLDINFIALREKEDRMFSMQSEIDMSALGAGMVPFDTEVKAMGRDTVMASLDILYPIYTGGKISSVIKQAKLNELIAKTAIVREELNVVYDIKKYYTAYSLSSKLEDLASRTLDRMEFMSSITKDFFENGESLNIKKTDYLNVQLVVSLIESTLSKIQAQKQMLKLALINTMGIEWNSKVSIIVKDNEIKENKSSLENLVETAFLNNSDIQKMKLLVKITKEQITEAKAGYYPDVAFKASSSKFYNSYEYGILNEEQANSWNVSVVAKMNIFNAGRTTNEVKEKRLTKNKMLVVNELVEEATAIQIQNELIKAKSAYKQMQNLKKSKELAREHRELNMRGYQIDLITPEKVIESQYMEVYIKADYFKYEHDYNVAIAKIEKLIGKGLK